MPSPRPSAAAVELISVRGVPRTDRWRVVPVEPDGTGAWVGAETRRDSASRGDGRPTRPGPDSARFGRRGAGRAALLTPHAHDLLRREKGVTTRQPCATPSQYGTSSVDLDDGKERSSASTHSGGDRAWHGRAPIRRGPAGARHRRRLADRRVRRGGRRRLRPGRLVVLRGRLGPLAARTHRQRLRRRPSRRASPRQCGDRHRSGCQAASPSPMAPNWTTTRWYWPPALTRSSHRCPARTRPVATSTGHWTIWMRSAPTPRRHWPATLRPSALSSVAGCSAWRPPTRCGCSEYGRTWSNSRHA